MSVFSDIQICSGGALLVGAEPFASFGEEGNPAATLCGSLYPIWKEGIMSGHPWKFLSNRKQLSRLVAPPENQWTFKYILPPDRIGLQLGTVYTSNVVGAKPFKEFSIEENVLFTEALEIHMQYYENRAESFWPPYFVHLMTYVVATELSIPISADLDMRDRYYSQTYGTPSDNGLGGLMGTARNNNAKESPPRQVRDFVLIDARNEGVS